MKCVKSIVSALALICTINQAFAECPARYPNGNTFKYADGSMVYPNGSSLRYSNGSMNYPNGSTMRYSNGSLNYPNGSTLRYSNGAMNYLNGSTMRYSNGQVVSPGRSTAEGTSFNLVADAFSQALEFRYIDSSVTLVLNLNSITGELLCQMWGADAPQSFVIDTPAARVMVEVKPGQDAERIRTAIQKALSGI